MKHIYFLGLSLLFSTWGLAQSTITPSRHEQDSLRFEQEKAKAMMLGLPLSYFNDGALVEFQYFAIDGTPVYYITHNRDAGKTIATDKLYNGGGLNLDLSGSGLQIGEWDGGKVRLTHVELAGRVTQMDGASSLSDHATHVAVTLIGGGVKAAARGMAYNAELLAYSWSLDESEMKQAAANGLLISNHSYGNITGWHENKNQNRWEWYGDTSISADEDWKFGFYNNQAFEWDQIAHDYPHYLIVKSAGNTRNDKLPDGETHWVWNGSSGSWVESTTPRIGTGPYDCISGSGTSKNVLTVGAVNAITAGYSQPSDVKMSTFSSWGPTDDGRIKPDLCANGVGVNSGISSGDSAYATYNGTSMASPSLAGSLLLLQEHYHNLNNTYMKAATLKGLAIHTADEAGSDPGPDYSYGWGLANMSRAAQTISNSDNSHQIIESSLQPNSDHEVIVYNDGTTPLWATISWTDPEGTISSASLDPGDIKLINDLDLRIERISDNQDFFPWIMDPANPTDPATTGNNIRDNVEQVEILNPQAGFYRIRVSAGNLQNNLEQAFALIISGEAPGLQADFSIGSNSLCTYNGIPFHAEVLGTPDTYTWTFFGPDTLNYTGSDPHVLFEKTGVYSVKLLVSNPATSDSILKTNLITIQASPDYTIEGLSGLYCDNDFTTYKLTEVTGVIYSGEGVSSGRWSPNIAGAGSHWIYGQLTGTNGCVRTDSTTVFVESSDAPPVISIDQKDLVTSASGQLQWYLDGQVMPGDTLNRITPTVSGTYRVDLTNAAGCVSPSDDIEFWMTSITRELQDNMKVYPNPSNGRVKLEFNRALDRYIELFDSQGKRVYARIHDSQVIELDLENLSNGLYQIKVSDEQQVLSQTLVIQR